MTVTESSQWITSDVHLCNAINNEKKPLEILYKTCFLGIYRMTENAGRETNGWNCRHEIAGHENAGH